MKTEKEKKFKIFKYILYIILGICLSYNIIFLMNTTITGNDYITIFGITFFNMENDLMKDDISANDLVIVCKVQEKNLQEGDIIAYTVNGQTRINKIINTKDGYTTKSNKNYYPNIEKVYYEDVIGKKINNIPSMGIMLKILQSRITSFLIFLFLICLVGYNRYMFIKKNERSQKKKNMDNLLKDKLAGGKNG